MALRVFVVFWVHVDGMEWMDGWIDRSMRRHTTMRATTMRASTAAKTPTRPTTLRRGSTVGRRTRATTRALGGQRRDAGRDADADEERSVGRRAMRGVAGAALALAMLTGHAAHADSLPDEEESKVLCDAECARALETKDFVTTKSGLRYKEIKEGDGIEPPVGFQVVVDYVAMDEKGRVFDNSLAKGKPNDIRVVDCVGSGDFDSCTVIPGMDEGLLTMKSGGVRRLYIPGELAFPKGLASAPGRPKIAPFSPVIFDVNLIYIPGFD